MLLLGFEGPAKLEEVEGLGGLQLEEVEGLGGLQGGTGGLSGSSPLPQPEPPLLLPLLLLLGLSLLLPLCWPRPRPWPCLVPPGNLASSFSLGLPLDTGGNSSPWLSFLQGWGLESEWGLELGLLLQQE